MPTYAPIGYGMRPEGVYIPEFASHIIDLPNFETVISEAIKSLGRPQTRLSSLIIEQLFAVKTPELVPGTPIHKEFLHIMIKIMASAGYVKHRVPIPEFRSQPHRTLDELTSLVLASRLRYPTAEDLGGQYAGLQQLEAVMLTILRDFLFVTEESTRLVQRFRLGLGNIGYKIRNRMPISQFERSIFAAYRDPSEGSLGFSIHDAVDRIPAKQVSDDLVTETMAMYEKVAPATTFWSNLRLVSDMNLEHLTMLLGVIPEKMTYYAGYVLPFGPFSDPRIEPVDTISWSPDQQMRGISNTVQYLTRSIGESGTLHIRTPTLERNSWLVEDGGHGVLLDSPDITWHLKSEDNIADAYWSYHSKWRGRPMHSDIEPLDLSDYLVDVGLVKSGHGANAFSNLVAFDAGPADYSYLRTEQGIEPWFATNNDDAGLVETFYIPERGGGSRLVAKEIDMSMYYVRRGKVAARSAFGELAIPERTMFFTTDENVVRHVGNRLSLTTDEQLRYARAIGFAHEVARWSRVTGAEPAFGVKNVIAAMFGFTV